MEEQEEKLEIDRKRLKMAFDKLIEVFDELAEKGVTEAELMLATHFTFQARIIMVYTRDLFSVLSELLEERESYAS